MRISFFFILGFIIHSVCLAEVGKVTQVLRQTDAYLLRAGNKIPIQSEMELEEGDMISSLNSVVQIYLYPSSQVSIAPNTEMTISKIEINQEGVSDIVNSVIEYIKGVIRVQVTKESDQKIEQIIKAQDVAFAVRGTEFEVSREGDKVDLDVEEGEVEVSSPYVNTFVPEIVKKGEGFRFDGKQRSFSRRKFFIKFKDHPKFAKREELRDKWKAKRLLRKQKRLDNKQSRQELKEKQKERNKNRRK